MVKDACPSQRELQHLLDGQLPSEPTASLTQHVGVCSGCQEQLDHLACDDAQFSKVVRHIDQDNPPTNSAFWHALDAVEAEGASTTILAPKPVVRERARGSDDIDHPSGELKLDFLQPPEVPTDLGKLGSFRILRVVGRGGMGVVLHGFDPSLSRDIAVKVLDPQLAGNETARARFCREARAAAAVTHENLVAVHQVDVDHASGLPFLVMQLVNGESLDQRLKRVSRLNTLEVTRLGMQAAAGLAAAHAGGLIHRDIKPGNILIEKDTERVKLTDFGLARAVDDVKLTRTGFVAGTPLYMAPEQARGEDVDARADLFSLGTVLYETCAGKPPFDGKTPLAVLRRVADEAHVPLRTLVPEVPAWLSEVVDRLLEKEPEKRFQTASEVAEIFAEELSNLVSLSPLDVPAEVCSLARTTSGHTRRRSWQAQRFHVGCVARRVLPWAGGILIGGLAVGIADWSRPPLVATNGDPAAVNMTGDAPVGPEPIAIVQGGKSGSAWALDFSPDHSTIVTGFDSGDVKFWDVRDSTLRGQLAPLEGTVWAAEFSNDGNYLVTASDDGQAIVWEMMTYSFVKKLPHPTSVKAAAFSPNGKKVATGDRASTIRLWDLETQIPIQERGHRGTIHSVAFSPDGKLLASAGADRTAKIWRIGADRFEPRPLVLEHDAAVYRVAFSPDGTKVATASLDGMVRIWDSRSGGLLLPIRAHKEEAWSVSFNQDGSLLASSSSDGTVKLWEVATGKERLTLYGASEASSKFSRDGQFVGAGGRNGSLRVWNVGEILKK